MHRIFKKYHYDSKNVARILLVMQHSYQKVTTKEKKKSQWQENILFKIKMIEESVALLVRVKNHEKLDDNDTMKGKKIMRELNLVLERFEDIEEAIGILNQRAVVYKGKLDSFSNRVEFRKKQRVL